MAGEVEAGDGPYWDAVRAWFTSLSRWQDIDRSGACARPATRSDAGGHDTGLTDCEALRREQESSAGDLLEREIRSVLSRRPHLDPAVVRLLLDGLADEYERGARRPHHGP